MVSLEQTAVPLVDGWILDIQGDCIRIVVNEPLPPPVSGINIDVVAFIYYYMYDSVVLIVFNFNTASKTPRLYRIDMQRHSFGSKSMRSNIADLVSAVAEDGLPATVVGSRAFWERRRALIIDLARPVFRSLDPQISGTHNTV